MEIVPESGSACSATPRAASAGFDPDRLARIPDFIQRQYIDTAMLPGSVGEYYWGGMLSTVFFVDPAEGIIALFMTQVMPSTAVSIRRKPKTLMYAALADSRI